MYVNILLNCTTGVYPDANLGQVLSSRTSSFDYALIQLYNPCGYSSNDNAVVTLYKQWTGDCSHPP